MPWLERNLIQCLAVFLLLSFPLKLESYPNLAEWGAYSEHKVYTADDIRDLVRVLFNLQISLLC